VSIVIGRANVAALSGLYALFGLSAKQGRQRLLTFAGLIMIPSRQSQSSRRRREGGSKMCEDCCPCCGREYYEEDCETVPLTPEEEVDHALRNSKLGLAAHPDNAELLSDWNKTRNCEMTFKVFADKWLPYIKAEVK
jgi:hypothetical protein